MNENTKFIHLVNLIIIIKGRPSRIYTGRGTVNNRFLVCGIQDIATKEWVIEVNDGLSCRTI
jgi:hypothetical protein